jgi:hypothetical protein
MTIDPGPRPELAWLPIERLFVDERYQRDLKQRHVNRIAENFRWSRFQAVLVTKCDKGWSIIDGQHRVEAAKVCGLDLIPAVVIDQADIAEQAASFVWANAARATVPAQAMLRRPYCRGYAKSQAWSFCATRSPARNCQPARPHAFQRFSISYAAAAKRSPGMQSAL